MTEKIYLDTLKSVLGRSIFHYFVGEDDHMLQNIHTYTFTKYTFCDICHHFQTLFRFYLCKDYSAKGTQHLFKKKCTMKNPARLLHNFKEDWKDNTYQRLLKKHQYICVQENVQIHNYTLSKRPSLPLSLFVC